MKPKSLFFLLSMFLLVQGVLADSSTPGGGAWSSAGGQTYCGGSIFRVVGGNTINLSSVTKEASDTSTQAKLFNVTCTGGGVTLVKTVSYSGNTATFGGDNYYNNGSCFIIVSGNGGAAYTQRYKAYTYPTTSNSITWQNRTSGANVAASCNTPTSTGIGQTEVDSFTQIDYTNYSAPPNATANFSATAINTWNSASINSFNLTMTSGATTYNFGTTTGTITTSVLQNSTSLWNLTYYSTGVFFNTTYINVNVSTNHQGSMNQSKITVNLIEYDNNVSLSNFSLNISGYGLACNTPLSYCVINPLNGSYTVNNVIDNTGNDVYTLLNSSFTVSPLDVKDVNLYVFEHSINVSAKNIFSNATINNFSLVLVDLTDGTDNRNYTTVVGWVDIPVIHHNYSITVYAEGYAYYNNAQNFSITSDVNYTFYFYTKNSFNISFYDEVTKNLLNGYNISLEIIGDSYSNNYSTSNGTLYIDLLTPELYLFRFKSLPDYSERFYYYNLVNNSFNDIKLYLINDSATIIVTVRDEDNDIITGAYLKIQRYDLTTNAYTTREIVKTDVTGNAYFLGKLNSEFYKYIVEYPLGVEVLETTPDYIRSSTITLRVNLQQSSLDDYFTSINTYANLTFNNATNNFRCYYNDASNGVTQGCLYIYEGDDLINSSCVDSASATILSGVTNETGVTYVAQCIATINGETYLLKTLSHTFPKTISVSAKNNFFILTLLLTLIIGLITFSNLTVFFMLTPLPIFIMSLIQMIPLSRGVGITILLIGLTLSIVTSKRT